MTRLTWYWPGVLSVLVGLGLTGSGWAQEKKVIPKGEEGPKVIIIQLDASKLPPEFLKQLMSLSQQGGAKGGDKKPDKPEQPQPQKGEVKPKGNPDAKVQPQKPNIVQVDVNKLSPEVANLLMKELARIKAKETEKGGKKDDDKKGENKNKNDNNDDDKKGNKKQDKDDDDEKGSKKKKDKDDD